MRKKWKRIGTLLLAVVFTLSCVAGKSTDEVKAQGSSVAFTEDVLVTPADVGIPDNTYRFTDTWLVKEGTLSGGFNGKVFSADVQFSEAEACIRLAGKDSALYGINLSSKTVKGYLCLTAANGEFAEGLTFLPEKIGFNPIGTKFNLKVSIEYVNTSDVKIGVFFNDVLYNNEYLTVQGAAPNLGEHVGIVLGNDADASLVVGTPLLGVLTPADFLLDDKVWSRQNSNGAPRSDGNMLSIVNREFAAKVKFSGDEADLFVGGADDGEVPGLNGIAIKYISSKSTTNLYLCSNEIVNGYTYELTPEIAGTQLVDNEFELRIRVQAIDYDGDGSKDDMALSIYINGVLYNQTILYANDVVNKFGRWIGMYFGTTGSLSLKCPELPTVTPSDFGIPDGSYTANGAILETAYPNGMFINKTFHADVKFSKTKAQLHLAGGTGSLHGFILKSDGIDNLQFISADLLLAEDYTITPEDAGMDQLVDKTFDLKISMRYCARDMDGKQNDLQIGLYFNDQLYKGQYIYAYNVLNDARVGNYIGMWTDPGASIELSEPSGQISEDVLEERYYNITEEPYVVVSSLHAIVNGQEVVSGTELTQVGDYVIHTTQSGRKCVQNVYLWKSGDVNGSNEVDIRDLIHLKKIVQETITPTEKYKLKAADVNGNAVIDGEDCNALRKYFVGQNDAVGKSTPYSVFANRDVMPVGGFMGPHGTYKYTDGTLLNGTVNQRNYDLIADAGINLVLYSTDDGGVSALQRDSILEQLEYCEKKGISMLVNDKLLVYPKDDKTFISRLAGYSKYKSFAGIHVLDEPGITGVYPGTVDSEMSGISRITTKLNSYANTMGFVNLLPYMSIYGTEENYKAYLEQYCETCNPKVLSFDYYPFSQERSTAEFLKNLSFIRQSAMKSDIPFWSYIQAGADFGYNLNGGVYNTPTQGEMTWNVNVNLAFGAKGIQYFPLLQPYNYVQHTTSSSCGLIGYDGNTTKWYDYAKNINTYIQKIDHVLMNAESKSVIATGTAAEEANGLAGVLTSYRNTTVSSSSSKGALVGCFDYLGKTAYYVVNYDTVNEATVTLDFSQELDYSFIAKDVEGAAKSSVYTRKMSAGEAVLIVME